MLTQKVKKNLHDSHLFGRGATVIVGVSGGPDSTALATILHNLQYQLGFHLHIAHFNHNYHRSANTNQKFVEGLADDLNVPCSVDRWKNPRVGKNGSFEDAARRHRFQFFNRLAKKIGAGVVVLAHTQDDLAETVLMRILRGTGLQGLRGILPRREMDGICFVRPFLGVKKSDILAFLKKKNISFRSDPTNKQTKYFRNKIRLELLPLLAKHYSQNINELLTNIAINTKTDYDFIELQAQELFAKLAKCSGNRRHVRFDLRSFSRQHPALKRMLIRNGIEYLKGDTRSLNLIHFREIEDLLQNRPKKAVVDLPRNICARKDLRNFILSHK